MNRSKLIAISCGSICLFIISVSVAQAISPFRKQNYSYYKPSFRNQAASDCQQTICKHDQVCSPFGKCVLKKDTKEILDNYVSLAPTRAALMNLKISPIGTRNTITAYSVLFKFLNDSKYSPILDNKTKSKLISDFFSQYSLPQQGTKMFIISVANGLWTEANAGLPWSLKQLTPEQVSGLFIQNDGVNDNSASSQIGRPFVPNIPNAQLQTHVYEQNGFVEEAQYKQYALAISLMQDAKDQKTAAQNIATWAQKNFFHADDVWSWGVYLDGRNVKKSDISDATSYPLSLDRVYDERVIGCQEPTILLEGIFHNLNIPAVRLSFWQHGVLYLPTLDLFIHGDAIASYKYPVNFILLNHDQFLPIASNEKQFIMPIYQAYSKKYSEYITIVRENSTLKILSGPFYDYPQKTCKNIPTSELNDITKDYSEFSPYYDKTDCYIKSKVSKPIQSLDALNGK